jgi:hypothetical protein
MTRPSTRPTIFAAALSLTLAAAMLAPAPARAEDEDVPLDSKILRGLLEAIGLRKDGEAINYQERAPLVIPPSRALPTPEKSDALIANNPAWPKDPDVQRAKEEAARERNKIRSAEEQILNAERRMSESEMTPGRNSRTVRRAAGVASPSDSSTFGNRLSASELGYKGGLFSSMFGSKDDESARFTGEPARTMLTEPPPGYQTPSPDQPFGLGAGSNAPKAENNYIKRGEGQQ